MVSEELNQQIAVIAGWTNVRLVRRYRGGAISDHIKKSANPHNDFVQILMGKNTGGRYCKVPDYLAPEDRHELERVVGKVCYSYDHEWCGSAHTYELWDEGGKRIAYQTSTRQSDALAKAIVEAKG